MTYPHKGFPVDYEPQRGGAGGSESGADHRHEHATERRVPPASSDLDRILRRGKVEIENVIVTTGYTPYEEHEDGRRWQTAIQAPAVQVKWWANGDRRRIEHSRVYWRFMPKDRIGWWFYNQVFADTYYESTKPTLHEALADVEEHTRPRYDRLDEMVAENEWRKEGAALVGGLLRCA